MKDRVVLPAGIEVSILLAAGLAWMGVAATRTLVLGGLPLVAGGVLLALAGFAAGSRSLPTGVIAGLLAAALVSGIGSGLREAATLEGLEQGTATDGAYRIVSDPIEGRWGGHRFLGRSEQGLTLLFDASISSPQAGERWILRGRASGPAGRWRGVAHAGIIDVTTASLDSSGGLVASGANRARKRVAAVFETSGSAGGLVSGFLIGETSAVSVGDLMAMRASGLSHFVAVSGSNVALFLGLWWMGTFFIGFGPRRRAVLGIVGLLLFVWMTRWEPSVVRAAVMAGMILVSRAVGLPLTGWSALGLAVTGITLVSGELVDSVGFQLSVAATCGVMLGHRAFAVPVVGPLLSATAGAQIAVAPLVLFHFGSVPIISPLANLVAVPLVTGATTLGAVATVIGSSGLAAGATWLGEIVLRVAHLAAGFPQVGAPALSAMLAAAFGWRWAPVRVASIGVVAVWATWQVMSPPPIASGIVIFDVGQGDSILLVSDAGGVVLIDGGPDETIILEKLREYRINAIDLVVNTHPHYDHANGLVAVVDSVPVGLIWRSGFPGEETDDLAAAAARHGVGVVTPTVGSQFSIRGIQLLVLGPQRRYASPNDQSIVLVANVNDVSIALVGDIETHAQADLGAIHADVLKVPHQGAATSDLRWVRESSGSLAVISVGPNQYGHPDLEVIEALTAAGATVLRTDEAGDVVIRSKQDALAR